MIIKPWTKWNDYEAEGYTLLTTFEDITHFTKYKRKMQVVKLVGDALPIKCNYCNEVVAEDQNNHCIIWPKQKRFKVMHYKCCWQELFHKVPRYYAEMYLDHGFWHVCKLNELTDYFI